MNVIDRIKAYKKKKNAVYLIGVKYFIFIDITKNSFELYDDIEDLSPEMKGDFEALTR